MPFINLKYIRLLQKQRFQHWLNRNTKCSIRDLYKLKKILFERIFSVSFEVIKIRILFHPDSSVFPLRLRVSTLDSGSDLVAGPAFMSSGLVLKSLRVCPICSLGLFQEGRVAIQSTRPPKATISRPRTLTKMDSGGESL